MSSPIIKLGEIVAILTESYGTSFLNNARDLYFLRYGKPAWDEPFYETRMNLFIEWFLLEYVPTDAQKPLLRAFESVKNNNELLETLNAYVFSHYSIFDIEAPWKKKNVYLRDVIYGGDWHVFVDPEIPALDLPVLIQGRLIRIPGGIGLSDSVIVHPSDARESIYNILDKSKNQPLSEVTELLARLYIRRWRYPGLPSIRFYDLSDPLVKDIAKKPEIR